MNDEGRDALIKKSQREIAALEKDLEDKLDDIGLIDGILGKLPEEGLTTPRQDKQLARQIGDLMRDLANDQSLDPAIVTEDSLKASGLPEKVVLQELKLKDLLDLLLDPKPVDIAHLRAELDSIMKDLQKAMDLEEAEVAIIADAANKLQDINLLKDFEDKLPNDGLTTPAQNLELKADIEKIMRDLAKDPELDPQTVNKENLREKGLSPSTIDEILLLKDLWDDLAKEKPLDVKDLKANLEKITNLMAVDAADGLENADAMKKDDPLDIQLRDLDKLEALKDGLPEKGPTTDDQSYQVMKTVEDVMRDLAKDPTLDPKTVTPESLMAASIDPKTADEIMKLKDIHD